LTQDIKCTECGYVLGVLNIRTMKFKSLAEGGREYDMPTGDGFIPVECPGCGWWNLVK
jgi:ribosomal protein S27E